MTTEPEPEPTKPPPTDPGDALPDEPWRVVLRSGGKDDIQRALDQITQYLYELHQAQPGPNPNPFT